MEKFEYKLIGSFHYEVSKYKRDNPESVKMDENVLTQQIANKYGKDGWEAIDLRGDIWLKRKI